ncbi:MAG: peptidase domain-containing ABC transporter, partial [Pseudomonadota bacterium]
MALALRPTEALFGEPETRFGLGRFVARLRPHVDLLGQAFLATVLVGALGLATPLFSQAVVDRVLGQGQAQLLDVLLLGAGAAAVFAVLAALLRQYLLIHVSQRLALRLEADLFRHALRLPIGYFQRRKTGDVLTRFADNARIRDLLTGQAMQTAADALTAIVYFIVLFAYSTELALIALGFLGLAAAVALISAPALKRNDQRLFDRTAASQSKLVETITRIGAVKAAAAETAVRWAYEETVVQEALAAYRSEKLRMVIGALSRAIGLAAGLIVLWRGAHLALDGELSVGQLVAFMGVMALAMQPAMAVVAMWGAFQEALVSVARLADVYETAPEAAEGRTVAPLPRLKGHIQFENVTFRYQSGAKPALANVSLEIHPGQTAAIVGRSGSGKSTLAGLLQRMHRPENGRIRVDGVDLASVDLRSLRRQLGVVLQEDALFTGTIRENIALGDPEAPMERIVTAAKLAAAHDFIAEFPMGYDTIVGEVGVALSGGQRQRVAIARALLHEPAILIFDEATSALDAESEAAIRRNLRAILQDRTAIVIAHRLSTVRDADVIFVIDEGVIVERGSHGELLDRKGLYAYLVAQQVGG